MDLEVVRAVSAWLNDGSNGVNAQIASVPRDAADDPPESVKAVLDETTSTIVALRQIPEDQPTPFLLVWTIGEAGITAVNQGKQDIEGFGVAVACVHREVDAAAAVRDGSYLMRAAKRSLNRLHENANLASRTRNQIEIRNGNIQMRWIRPELEIASAIVSRGIGLTYRLRDEDP